MSGQNWKCVAKNLTRIILNSYKMTILAKIVKFSEINHMHSICSAYMCIVFVF